MADWPGNNRKMTLHNNCKLKFSESSLDVLIGLSLQFGVI